MKFQRSNLFHQMWNEIKISFHIWWRRLDRRNIMTESLLGYYGSTLHIRLSLQSKWTTTIKNKQHLLCKQNWMHRSKSTTLGKDDMVAELGGYVLNLSAHPSYIGDRCRSTLFYESLTSSFLARRFLKYLLAFQDNVRGNASRFLNLCTHDWLVFTNRRVRCDGVEWFIEMR